MDKKESFDWLPDFDTYLREDMLIFLANIHLVKNAGKWVGDVCCDTFLPSDFLTYFSIEAFISRLQHMFEKFRGYGLKYEGLILNSESQAITNFFMAFDAILKAPSSGLGKEYEERLWELFFENDEFSNIYYYDEEFHSCINRVKFEFFAEDVLLIEQSFGWLNITLNEYLEKFKKRLLRSSDEIVYSNEIHQELFQKMLEACVREQGHTNIKISFDKPEYMIEGIALKKNGFRFIECALILQKEREFTINAIEKKDMLCIDILPKVADIEFAQQKQKKASYEKLNVFDPEFGRLQVWQNGALNDEILFSDLPRKAIKYIHDQCLEEGKNYVSQEYIEKKVSSPYQNIFREGAKKRHKTSEFLQSRKKRCRLNRPYAIEYSNRIEFFE